MLKERLPLRAILVQKLSVVCFAMLGVIADLVPNSERDLYAKITYGPNNDNIQIHVLLEWMTSRKSLVNVLWSDFGRATLCGKTAKCSWNKLYMLISMRTLNETNCRSRRQEKHTKSTQFEGCCCLYNYFRWSKYGTRKFKSIVDQVTLCQNVAWTRVFWRKGTNTLSLLDLWFLENIDCS